MHAKVGLDCIYCILKRTSFAWSVLEKQDFIINPFYPSNPGNGIDGTCYDCTTHSHQVVQSVALFLEMSNVMMIMITSMINITRATTDSI